MTERITRWRSGLAILALAFLGAACSGDGGSTSGTVASVDAPDALGAYAVGHTMFTLVDDARDGRELIVNVWYPVDAADAEDGPRTEYPLQSVFTLPSEVAVDDLPVSSEGPLAFLVFSHGFGGINTQSTQLMEALASHGFIVASPEHTGNTALDSSDESPAEKRVPDVSAVIDEMFTRSNTVGDAFDGRVDESKVGVLGHSFGGSTAMGMVAGWAGADKDPRVKAIGVIAGGVGASNFSEEALAAVTEPTILFVGTLDSNALENHNYAFDRMPNAEPLFKVEVTGANHTHFANVCAIGNLLIDQLMIPQDRWPTFGAEALIQPYNDTCTDEVFPIAEAHRLQNLYMVAHFKRYLLEQTGYDRFLSASYAAANEPAITFVAK
ncbi:MAG: alpha/beta fold hydrolase [Polyangiales bacterium]